jgi:hypothetical protein
MLKLVKLAERLIDTIDNHPEIIAKAFESYGRLEN